jgi:hypothetical protein
VIFFSKSFADLEWLPEEEVWVYASGSSDLAGDIPYFFITDGVSDFSSESFKAISAALAALFL